MLFVRICEQWNPTVIFGDLNASMAEYSSVKWS
jgi:hypothetical protein